MIKQVFDLNRPFASLVLVFSAIAFLAQPLLAQTTEMSSQSNLQSLRSDVGINGLTANFHSLSNFTDLRHDTTQMNDTLRFDDTSELEIVFRDVRMITPRLGVGFQVVTSFFTGNSFGVGSYGAGPVVRAYPFKTDRIQPYVQGNALLGNNLAVGKSANFQKDYGFRIRLGLRGGLAIRLSNSIGIFTEVGYDWESSRIFDPDSRVFQTNLGVDLYLFN